MNIKILERLGLSPEESSIYVFLLENYQKNITDISKATGINRPKLYKILPNMEQMGLISQVITGKRKVYIAENPKILNGYFENIKQDFNIFIPEIQNIYKHSFSKPIFKHLKWKSGIKNIFMDIAHTLNTWDIFYRYSSRNSVEKTNIPKSEYNQYKTIRNQKKIGRYVITNEYLQSLKPEKLDKEVVIIPQKIDLFEDNITKIIYKNKVAIIDYNTEESFIIESQVFATFEKKIFKLLFKFLKNI